MKVKFNLPVSRHNSKLNFDYNSTFDFGQIQPSFCKFCVPKAKYNVNLSQLVRTAPLVVPSFGRMAFHNLFCYVPMSMVMPAFDAFISQTKVQGVFKTYVNNSVPTVTNKLLVCMLLLSSQYSRCYTWSLVRGPQSDEWNRNKRVNKRFFDDGLNGLQSVDSHDWSEVDLGNVPGMAVPDFPRDFVFDYQLFCKEEGSSGAYFCGYKLTQLGRQLYNVLRGLGYSLDYTDYNPVSALPILAYGKAVYDLLYPHRDTPFHVTALYNLINGFYQGNFTTKTIFGHNYDIIGLNSLASGNYSILLDALQDFLLAPVGSDITQVATASPILPTSSSPQFDGITYDAPTSTGLFESPQVVGKTLIPSLPSLPLGRAYSADCLRLVDRLWSFVQRSSAVGQDVRNWFKLHFGVQPTEDMFNQTVLFKDVVNQLNINTVVSTADTSSQNGEVLGGLAGQSYSADSSNVSFDTPNFGFVFCLTYVVPICRSSAGTQPELYNTSYWDFPFPDFDGLGYESLNDTSFQESAGLLSNNNQHQGFGFVPRLTSYKVHNNIRSGGFSLPTLRDNYLPYCLDKVLLNTPNGNASDGIPTDLKGVTTVTSEGLDWYFPYHNFDKNNSNIWRQYDNIFYNTSDTDSLGNTYSPNNFMCQSSFGITVSSYLKPISDSFEIDNLFKNVTSVHKS